MTIFEILLTIFVALFFLSIFFLIVLLNTKNKLLMQINIFKKKDQENYLRIDELLRQIDEYKKDINHIITKIPHGIVLLDQDLKISFINDSIANLLYINKETAVGSKTIYVFNNKNLEDLIEDSIKYLKPQRGNIIFYGEEEISIDVEAIPLDLKNFKILILFKNVTQEFEFSKLRSQFVANISHEMRTPLTSIKGYIETILDFDFENLKNNKNEKDKLKNYLSKTLIEVDRLSDLIKDILNLSDIEYKRNIILKQPVDVVSSIKEVVESLNFLAVQNKIKIYLKVNKLNAMSYNYEKFNILKNLNSKIKEKIIIISDQELFNQLIKNILENSIFHGGPETTIYIDVQETDSELILTFIDNGVGIDKDDLPFIFQRFYRGKGYMGNKHIGSGLGLAIVKHIVELHNGTIKVSSIPKKETKFLITLPK